MHEPLTLRRVATASAALLATLCTITLVSGVSQQWFEWARAPDIYSRALVRDASALRLIIALDDVFIATYVTTSVLFVRHLGGMSKSTLHTLAVVFGVTAGVLDLEENHHLLALLGLAEQGVVIPLDEIVRRSDLSQLKWMLGHVAFFMIGLGLGAKTPMARLFRDALVFVQLPIGAITWAVPEGPLLTPLVWLRYGALVSGFVMVAHLSARTSPKRGDDGAVGSGAPA